MSETPQEGEFKSNEDPHLPRVDFKISRTQAEKLDGIGERLNLSSRTEVVRYLTAHYLHSSGELLPVASFENIMRNEDPLDTSRTPIVIIAKPKGGKSLTLDAFLKQCAESDFPFIVFTQKTEPRAYSWIQKRRKYRNFNAARVIRLKNHAFRVDLDPDEHVRLGEVERICEDLLRLQVDKHLKAWILVFDEGSSYIEIPSFLRLFREMRKYVNRLITTSTESGLLQMCEEMRPLPLQRISSKDSIGTPS